MFFKTFITYFFKIIYILSIFVNYYCYITATCLFGYINRISSTTLPMLFKLIFLTISLFSSSSFLDKIKSKFILMTLIVQKFPLIISFTVRKTRFWTIRFTTLIFSISSSFLLSFSIIPVSNAIIPTKLLPGTSYFISNVHPSFFCISSDFSFLFYNSLRNYNNFFIVFYFENCSLYL